MAHGMTAYACAAIMGSFVIWAFYRQRSGEKDLMPMHSAGGSQDGGQSAFRTPVVWALAILVGMIGMASYSVTFFVPPQRLRSSKWMLLEHPW